MTGGSASPFLLAFFHDRGRFPRQESEVNPQGIATLSQQLNVPTPVDAEAFLVGRTAERIRSEIRVRFDFREATVADADALTAWLRDHVADAGGEIEAMTARREHSGGELDIYDMSLPIHIIRYAKGGTVGPDKDTSAL